MCNCLLFHIAWMPMTTPHHQASPHLFFLSLAMKHQRPGLIEPCRCVGSHWQNVQAHNVLSIPQWCSETWPSPNCSYIPKCQTRWQPPAMPFANGFGFWGGGWRRGGWGHGGDQPLSMFIHHQNVITYLMSVYVLCWKSGLWTQNGENGLMNRCNIIY